MKIFLVVGLILVTLSGNNADKPCAAKSIPGESVMCVCNATYCDTLTRQAPSDGFFVYYMSSQKGHRFKKSVGALLTCGDNQTEAGCSQSSLTLLTRERFQTVQGFGGAATDSAGIHWRSLSAPLQQHLIDAYFSPSGIEYSMVRVPIGGSDFSTRPYAYNESPVNDTKLTNFSLTFEDYHYKLPLIKAGQAVAREQLLVVGTVWSPPPWMKTNGDYSGASRLKPEYYDTYADYYYKFIEQYAAQGVPVWGITTTNEPTNGVVPLNYFNSLGWTADTLGKWIAYHLGPKIRNSTFSHVKIIAGDDQRAMLPYWINKMLSDEPRALEYIDGVAVHFYTDFITPAGVLTEVMRAVPGKFLLATEACEGSFPWQRKKVYPGSWDRAYDYIKDIITDLNYGAVGWIDWNLCLNRTGGPNWAHNYVDSPIIVLPERDVFIKQPMFYGLGHFSKFIPRGSQRIRVLEEKPFFSSGLEHVAFVTPRKTIVLVFYNKGPSRTVNIRLGDKLAVVKSETKSVTTLEIAGSHL